MDRPWIASAEIDPDLPILKITDLAGAELRYLLGTDAQLLLGRVIMQISRDGKWRVTFFDEAGTFGVPHVLKVEAVDG